MKTKVLSINLGNFGSTGTIARGINSTLEKSGYKASLCFPGNRLNKPVAKNEFLIESLFIRIISEKFSRLTGFEGCFSVIPTLRLIQKMRKERIRIVHFHNLHESYLCLPLLFRFIKKNNICVIWTLHDCWSFTGQCPHFDFIGCKKWKTGCYSCPQYNMYPKSFFDNSKKMWKLKKKWFTSVEDMILVTPSLWLADLAKQSYLNKYPIEIINNGIDLSVFKPTLSDFRKNNRISEDKYVILGVSFGWNDRKGLDVFIELAKILPRDQYQIVLVGTDEKTDKELPLEIISIHRTQNRQKLTEIYSAADMFVNPTREEVLGLVNIEALACGTPVVTFNTGGSPECIDESCGSVVECDNIDALEKEIIRICKEKPFSKEACLKRAVQFDMNERLHEYVDLYEELLNDRITTNRI